MKRFGVDLKKNVCYSCKRRKFMFVLNEIDVNLRLWILCPIYYKCKNPKPQITYVKSFEIKKPTKHV